MKSTSTLKLLVVAFAAMLILPTDALAAEKADFSGKWVLNESKSELGEGQFFSAPKMTVVLEGTTMTIERTRIGRDGQERIMNETLTLDGKENLVEGENRTTKSIATWSDDGTSLTIKSDMEFNRQGETFQMSRTEVWTLGEDGSLKIQSDSSSAMGDRSVTLVYEKE